MSGDCGHHTDQPDRAGRWTGIGPIFVHRVGSFRQSRSLPGSSC